MATIRNKAGLIRKVPAFQAASPESVKRLSAISEVRVAERHTPLWGADQGAPGLLLIRTGILREAVGQGTRALTVGLHGKGELVGVECAYGLSAGASVDVYEDCSYLQFPADGIAAIARADVGVAFGLARLEATRRLGFQARLRALAQHPASQRLATALIELGERFGVRDSRGITVNLRLTHAELASLIGATRETVSFLMSDLRTQGLLERDGKRVVLRDRAGLNGLAAGAPEQS